MTVGERQFGTVLTIDNGAVSLMDYNVWSPSVYPAGWQLIA